MSNITREFTVFDDAVGVRLDKFLATAMPEFSRSEVQRFTVSRNGVPVKFSEKTKAGDKIGVVIPPAGNRYCNR